MSRRLINLFLTAYLSAIVVNARPVTEPNMTTAPNITDPIVNVPDAVDWRKNGAVTPVQSQAQCNSCWAFSAAAAIEGAYRIKTGKLIQLSKQQLVDCDKAANGCQGGGSSRKAFDYVRIAGGIVPETAYPYKGVAGECKLKSLKIKDVVLVTGYKRVPTNDEEALRIAVARQPIASSVEASVPFQNFKGEGVFKGPCGTDRNHALTIVGYGTDPDGTKFWIIKNSWPNWGANGFGKILRGVPEEGLCGIAVNPTYPTV